MLIKESGTKEIIKMDASNIKRVEFRKNVEDIFMHNNIKFLDIIHNISIETFGENEYFRVSKIHKDGMVNFDNGIYKIDNKDSFIDLLFNFKSECLTRFKRDLKAELEIFYKSLSDREKEKLITGLNEEKIFS